MTLDLSTVLNLALLAVVVYQAWRLAGAKAALTRVGDLMEQANSRLLEQLEHIKTQELFINDLMALLPPEADRLQETRA